MTPIGSTSSNIRRAIEFIVYSSCCRPRAPLRALTITWTTARRQTHRTTTPDGVTLPRGIRRLGGDGAVRDGRGVDACGDVFGHAARCPSLEPTHPRVADS